MIRFTFNEHEYGILFTHTPLETRKVHALVQKRMAKLMRGLDPQRKTVLGTTCKIIELKSNLPASIEKMPVISTGESYLHPMDILRFNKERGRQISMGRALKKAEAAFNEIKWSGETFVFQARTAYAERNKYNGPGLNKVLGTL